jgi:L-threonylcarbamoyladenylate synthase
MSGSSGGEVVVGHSKDPQTRGPVQTTPVFRLAKRGPSIRIVRSLVPILREGGVVLLPTDTIYGFSGRFDSLDARRRIKELKGSESASPMLSLVSGPEMVFRYAEAPHGASYDLLLKHWPGPLTAVLRARPHVPTEFCGPGDTLSFRWPVSPFLQALLGALGVPIFSTSANRAGEPTAHRFELLSRAFGSSLDAVIDGGELKGQASTIVDLTGSDPVVVRPGAVSL